MRIFLLAFFMAAGCLAAPKNAKVPQNLPDPGPGPLVMPKAPNFSTWSAVCTYKGADPEEMLETKHQEAVTKMASEDAALAKYLAANPDSISRKPRMKQMTVRKTGNIKQVITEYSSGMRSEQWSTPSGTVKKDASTGRFHLESLGQPQSENDFPEFDWVSSGNLTGIKSIKGRDCLIFEDQVESSRVEDPMLYKRIGASGSPEAQISVMAAIDQITRLPVSLQSAEQHREYTFLNPPAGDLILPPEFKAVIQRAEKQIKAAVPKLSPP